MTRNRHALSDEKWALVLPFIPKRLGRHGGDERLFIDAVLWIASTGSPWRDLPQELGHWNHVYQRFSCWRRKGHQGPSGELRGSKNTALSRLGSLAGA